MRQKKILILHTGGTLGMVGCEPGPFTSEKPSETKHKTSHGDNLELPFDYSEVKALNDNRKKSLLEKIPELSEIADIEIDILAQQDSCDVTSHQWCSWAELVRNNNNIDGIVIIHGTDTMCYTASVLSFLLEERPYPIVLTGSQRPLSVVRNDARQNLIDAVTLACSEIPETMICFGNLGLRGNRALKQSSTLMSAFVSPNCRPLFRLGVDVECNDHVITKHGIARKLSIGDNITLSWVLPNINPSSNYLHGLGVHIIACLGAGNLPIDNGWFELIKKEQDLGVIHLIVSQCEHGGINLGLYESSKKLLDIGAISGFDMTYIAAICKARVGLGQGFSRQELIEYLRTDVSGEFSM